MSEFLYRLILRVLPADVRREQGDEMAQLFRDYRREAAGHPLRVIGLWAAAIRDVLAQAAAERRARRNTPGDGRARVWALGTDVRHGLRLLRRYPSTSVLAVLTLAIGIGANTAIFSVVHAVLLRALPYSHPEQLVALWENRPKEGVARNVVSPADFVDWRQMSSSMAAMAAYSESAMDLVGTGDPVTLDAAFVSPGFFNVVAIRPQMGRGFARADEMRGGPLVVILSHHLWQERFGADPTILGRAIELTGRHYEVIGVLPAGFEFTNHSIDAWLPLRLLNTGAPLPRASHQLFVYGRLKPGLTIAQARDDMNRIGDRLEQQYSENRGHGVSVFPLQDDLVQPLRASLLVLLGGVGFVLVLACVNVSSLLLTRAVSRSREMAVRAALGGSRARLVTQVLVESVTLAVAGGAAGIGVGSFLIHSLPLVLPEQLSVVPVGQLSMNWPVLLSALALTGVTGLIAGLLPALHASRPDVIEPLKQAGRGAGGVRRGARIALVIGEITLAALTLVGAGLAVRSFAAVMAQPLGFQSHGRIVIDLAAPQARYDSEGKRLEAMRDLEHRLAALPGVTHVGAIDMLPLSGGDSRRAVLIEGREPVPDSPTRMHPRAVTPAYFRTMAIPILQGRAFGPEDDGRVPNVAIVNDAAVRRFWPDGLVIGKHVRFTDDNAWRTIVGVAADVRHWGLSKPVNPMIYLPEAQHISGALSFVLETALQPAALVPAARSAVGAFDAAIPVGNIRTLDEVVRDSVRAERAQTVLMTIFGLLALGLAAVGIYGVMAQLAAARTREVGIRLALGARPGQVLRAFLAEGAWQTAAGLLLGLSAGVALMRAGSTVLFGISPWDPTTLAAVAIVLMTSAIAACLIPARRAMKVDAAEVLRYG